MDLGYCQAPVNQTEFDDGYIRTFRQKDIPKFSKQEKKMIQEWLDDGNLSHFALYMTEPQFGYELDEDMVKFVIREVFRNDGNI